MDKRKAPNGRGFSNATESVCHDVESLPLLSELNILYHNLTEKHKGVFFDDMPIMDRVMALVWGADEYQKLSKEGQAKVRRNWDRSSPPAQRAALGIYSRRRRSAEEKELGL